MKTIRFLFVGKVQNPGFKLLEEFYLERIRHHHRDTVVEVVRDATGSDSQTMVTKEGANLLHCVEKGDFVVVCDERGKSFDSTKFSQKIQNWLDGAQRVNFVIGGAYGLAKAVQERASASLRLSDFTLPHELARVVLLEQVYRGLSLTAGSGYHH